MLSLPVQAVVWVHDEENSTATDRFARCFAFEARAIVRESDDRLKCGRHGWSWDDIFSAKVLLHTGFLWLCQSRGVVAWSL